MSNRIYQAPSDRPVTIDGDGSQARSFCYVPDLVDGLIRLMESEIDGLEPINLGNPVEPRVAIEEGPMQTCAWFAGELKRETPVWRPEPERDAA